MIGRLAWRNIWRSKTRSVVVILSIAIGVWALSFVLSFSNGITYTFIKNAIREQYSHIQFHHPQFPEDKNSKYAIKDAEKVLLQIRQSPEVESATSRTISTGMVSSPRGKRGVKITGIDPENEAEADRYAQRLFDRAHPHLKAFRIRRKKAWGRMYTTIDGLRKSIQKF